MSSKRPGGLFASDSEEEEGTTSTRIGLFEHDDEYDTIESIKERKQSKMKQLRDQLELLEEENCLLQSKNSYQSNMRSCHGHRAHIFCRCVACV